MPRRPTRRLLAVIAIGIASVAAGVSWSIAAAPYAPEQPIDFHHRDHVQTDRLDCELCHSGVRRSRFAGMPPVERCIGCHRFVLTANGEVAKLHRFYEAGKAIPWAKVYSLPRFVQFNHAAHLQAEVGCSTCHGDVAAIDRVARVAPLTMGWCVQCHRRTHAPDDCLTCHH
jgi:Cytochrome c7 and related cytochrome c